jgi:hypothetical protein
MADGTLNYSIQFDPQTGGLKLIHGELLDLGQKGKGAVEGIGGALGTIGGLVAGVGIEAMLGGAIVAALRTTEEFERMADSFKNAAFALAHPLAQGLEAAGTKTKEFGETAAVHLQRFFEDMTHAGHAGSDAIAAGVAAGNTKLSEVLPSQVDIIKETARLEAMDMTKSAGERLKIVDQGEKDVLALLVQTGDYQRANEKQKHLMILQEELEAAGQKRRITMQAQLQEVADLQGTHAIIQGEMTAALDAAKADYAEQLAAIGTTNGEKRRIITAEAAAEKTVADAQFADSMAMLTEQERIEPEKLAQIEKQKEMIRSKHAIDVVKIASQEQKDLAKIAEQEASEYIKIYSAIADSAARSFATRLAQTHSFHKAEQAAGDAAVIEAGKQASDYIKSQIGVIAVKAYSWGTTWGGPVGGALAAAAAIAGAEAVAAGVSVGAQAAVGPGEGGIDEGQPPAGTALPGGGTSSGVSAGGAPGSGGTTLNAGPGQTTIINVNGGDFYQMNRLAIAIAEQQAMVNAQAGTPVATSG